MRQLLLTIQVCSRLRCTAQPPLIFKFQMCFVGPRGCRRLQPIGTMYYLEAVSKTGAIAFRSGIPAAVLKEFPIAPEGLQAGLFLHVW